MSARSVILKSNNCKEFNQNLVMIKNTKTNGKDGMTF